MQVKPAARAHWPCRAPINPSRGWVSRLAQPLPLQVITNPMSALCPSGRGSHFTTLPVMSLIPSIHDPFNYLDAVSITTMPTVCLNWTVFKCRWLLSAWPVLCHSSAIPILAVPHRSNNPLKCRRHKPLPLPTFAKHAILGSPCLQQSTYTAHIAGALESLLLSSLAFPIDRPYFPTKRPIHSRVPMP
ncbi:hypothetical protein LY78DRAFT_298249 [Colletotrichum sublineola]|nr:hypothetical protein LY78DRAFT_298249 [Colletotrichum sublineola]